MKSRPRIWRRRSRRAVGRSSGAAGALRRVRVSSASVKPVPAWAMASRLTTSAMWPNSVRGALRNLRRAGVAWNRSRTSTCVPAAAAAGRTGEVLPASTAMRQPPAPPRGRLTMARRATAPIEGRASPRKPRWRISSKSSSGSFDVAWRSTASASSSSRMPLPSSATAMRSRPPPVATTSIRPAPASSAFSTSSLTTLAGRSTTSPAAMRLMTVSGSRRRVTPASARRCGARDGAAPGPCRPRPPAGRTGRRRAGPPPAPSPA